MSKPFLTYVENHIRTELVKNDDTAFYLPGTKKK